MTATTILLIRHAQADADHLSPLGRRQARLVGDALAHAGLAPGLCFTGTHHRHIETLSELSDGMWRPLNGDSLPALDELDFPALLSAWHSARGTAPEAGQEGDDLRQALADWQSGTIPNPPEPWEQFQTRIRAALGEIAAAAQRGGHRAVLAVSSRGPISAIVASLLGAPAAAQADLQAQMMHCAVTQIRLSAHGPVLHSFNGTPLLTRHDADQIVTYH